MSLVNLTLQQILDGLSMLNGKPRLTDSSQFTWSIGIPNNWAGYTAFPDGDVQKNFPTNGFQTFNAQQAANVQLAIKAWDELIVPNFTQVTESAGTYGELRFAFTTLTSLTGAYGVSVGWTSTPLSPNADIWFDTGAAAETFDPGAFPFRSLLHEIGHSLGLKHSFNPNPAPDPAPPTIPSPYENVNYTVMSYTQDPNWLIVQPFTGKLDDGRTYYGSNSIYASASTPMVLDIAAIQALYGADPTTRTGDDVYTFVEGATNVSSIYDAGGNDTIDLSNFTRNSVIDLRPGSYSSLGIWSKADQITYWDQKLPGINWGSTPYFAGPIYTWENNLGIAFSTTIENAVGGAGDDQLIGNDVANRLDGGAGADTMSGGLGDDIYVVDDVKDAVIENAGEGTDTVSTALGTSGSAYVLAANVENLLGTSATGQSVAGNALDNVVTMGAGGDLVDLSSGGNDTVAGGGGDDAFYFGAAFTSADRADGGAGKDIVALQGDYSGGVTLGDGSLINVETLSILTHSDNRFGGGSASGYSYVVNAADGAVAAGTQLIVNASNLEAGESLTFDGHLETDGSFFIYGGLGTDTLTGGAKADVFFFGENGRFGAGDHVDGGAGADILVLRGDYDIVMDGKSMTNIETVTLMSGADARFAPAGTPFHYAIETADDTVAAGAAMTFNGGTLGATETLSFDGSAETDGAFRVFGGAADDTITGGAGSDLLYGGLGADTLTGGGGNDTFRYQSAAESTASSMDRILDFASGDRIDLSRAGHFSFIGSDAFDGHAGQLRVEDFGKGVWLVQADADGDGQADFVLQVTVADHHLLTAGDFAF